VALGANLIAMNDTAQIESGMGSVKGFDLENSGRLPNRSLLFSIFNF
jgi:hypothetical protein